jgi:PAS domain S-box-containing protein
MPIALSRFADGMILDVNEGFLRFSGYTREEVVGRTALELKLYEHEAQRALVVGQLRRHGHLHDHEQLFRTKSGQFRNQLLWFELLTFSGEQCVLTITWDITERMQAADRERQAKDAFTQKLIASQETERSRIAGELHDSLGQNLILIKHRAQIGLDLAGASPTVRDQFQSLQDMAARAIAEVRHISHDLRPYQLDRLGLGRALEAMIDGAAENGRLPIARKLEPVDDLFSAEAATHLFRIAQESISNILKHAQARSAKVALERDVHDVRLWISDDGRGFAVEPGQSGLPAGGLGLSSMAERVEMLGGTLRIESQPGQGTRIEVTIPHAGKSEP